MIPTNSQSPNQLPTTSIGHKSDARRCDKVQGMEARCKTASTTHAFDKRSAKTARTGGLESARRSLTCVSAIVCNRVEAQ
jgi:hypothetical protein